MRCRYCGQRIPEGELYCRHCGKEVRIVPDYNPLDDMLTAQIKGAIDSDGYEDEMYYSRPHVTEMQLEDLQPAAVEEMKDAVQVWQEIIQETEADR